MRYYNVNAEFLIKAIAKNFQYIFLVAELLSIFGLINFNLNPKHFPELTLKSEILVFPKYTYNPVFIYGHYLYVFILIIKGFAVSFIEIIKQNWIPALAICLLIVNIWFAYTKHKKEKVHVKLAKSLWRESNLLERCLWMMFFIDILVFITSPGKLDIIFLTILYLLLISIKYVPWLSGKFIELTENLEKSFLHNKKVLFATTILDIALIYLDSQKLFALFFIVFVYNLIAYLVLKFLEEFKKLWDYAFYIFNFGMLVFFFSLVVIYYISFAVVLALQCLIIGAYYYKKKRFLPRDWIEKINGMVLVVLLILVFI